MHASSLRRGARCVHYTYAEARWSEGLADWIGVQVNALRALGGVPQAIVCDNLKAGRHDDEPL